MRAISGVVALICACASLFPAALSAQTGSIEGRVVSVDGGGVAEASVRVHGGNLGTLTDQDGRFRLDGLSVGQVTLVVSAAGYRTTEATVDLGAGLVSTAQIRLSPRPMELQGIRVSVLRPNLDVQGELTQAQVRSANPRDVGEVLRGLGGVDAVRRGPLGLDPVVRGLREQQVGTYLDGARMFPAGPARMDSPLSHLDPSAVSHVEVVKGPYALTWGGGNLSAIRVETESLPTAGFRGVRGNLSSGYDTNLEAAEAFGSVSGRAGRLSFWGHGAYREGADYEDGDGNLIDGEYESWEGRGKIGIDVSDATRLILGGGYQEQGPIEYPGRLLNADFFESLNTSFAVEHRPDDSPVSSLDFRAFYNRVDHGMNNAGKPTALPDPDRTPPFPLEVRVDSEIQVYGGRAALAMGMGAGWALEVGGDVYLTERNAVREIFNADLDTTTPLFVDNMWPDAELSNGGAFARVTGRKGDFDLSWTIRGDFIKANAANLSEFFQEEVGVAEEVAENTASGAVTLGYRATHEWTVTIGAGSVTRPADVAERYSDRIPATRAQLSAEFMGNPQLETERSNQADLWIEAHYPRFHGHVNGFVRRIDNWITVEATDLEKRLPLSPETVYRYVNGEADFWGVEASGSYAVSPEVTASVGGSYLWGRDNFLDEPAFGVAPLNGSAGVRYDDSVGRFYVEGRVTAYAEQTRVSATRGEDATEEWFTGDVRGGYNVGHGLQVRGGVLNLADRAYVNHLNARNPFTGARIPEAGRVFFLDLAYSFGR